MAHIFIIDDDRQLLQLISVMLERGGHASTTINDPRKALDELQKSKPDAVILDVMMPGLDGHTLCRQIRETPDLADLPIIILTARSQNIDRKAALDSGADEYMRKPVMPKELIAKLEELIAAKSPAPAHQPGVIIGFYSLRGGVGTTTMALNFAAALHKHSDKQVCFWDMSSAGSPAAVYLRHSPTTHWGQLDPDNLTWDQVDAQIVTHRSGLRFLPAPTLPTSASRTDLAAALTNLLPQHTDYIVVDLPSNLNPDTLFLLQNINLTFHVLAPEVISVHLAQQTSKFLSDLEDGVKQKAYLLNQNQIESPMPPTAVERALKTRIPFKIAHDTNQAKAISAGAPLTLSNAKSPLPAGMVRMAEMIQQRVDRGEL
ncbi:MAG TPA: response regulator [Anaerolineae bacterium]|nr:response regulator [Anaerolineae bacterium]